MWTVIWFLFGTLRVKLTGADPAWALERLVQDGVAFRKVQRLDAYSVCVTILRRDEKRTAFAAQRAMCEVEIIKKSGFGVLFGWVKKRPVFFLGLLACFASAIVLPKFVFFYEIVGNERVPEAQIRRELEALGVGFGTYGPDIRPQDIKNRMLVRIPELKWITVQQSGMCARVVVRERPEKEPVYDRKTPTDVIAAESGILTSVSCLSGNCLCQVGQAVEAGQVLVSAYTDLEFTTQVSAALAEIYAQTVHRTKTVLPASVTLKRPNGRTHTKVSFFTGRHRWTLFGGAWEENADSRTKILQFSLPGGYFFPFGIAITTISEYDTYETERNADEAQALLEKTAVSSVSRAMIAGTVRDVRQTLSKDGGQYLLRSRIRCEEMIARMVPAQKTKDDEP